MKAIYTRGTKGLNVRKTPDKSAEVVGLMEPNVPFEVEAVDWYRVEGGYVNAAFVEIVPDEVETDEADDDGEAPEEDCELYKMKVPELKKLAEDSGVKVTSTMKKNEIIEAIINA